jgi:hypothetical protein
MIPEKDKKYLIKYKFDQDRYTDIGIYTGKTYSDRGYTEYAIKVHSGTILVTYEEIIECVDNHHDGSTLDNFLLLEEYNKLKTITDRILREFPVGNIAEHTIESIPERVSYYLKELAEYTQRVEAWEKCADDLVDYAHEFVAHLSTWGKGYNRYDKDIKKAEDAIEEYLRLKNETT